MAVSIPLEDFLENRHERPLSKVNACLQMQRPEGETASKLDAQGAPLGNSGLQTTARRRRPGLSLRGRSETAGTPPRPGEEGAPTPRGDRPEK